MRTTQAIRRRDRWAEWAVVALVAVALVLGLALREAVRSRTVPFAFPEAPVSGRCPANWVRETGDDPLLRARDPLGGEFRTTIELRSRPLAAGAEPAIVLDALALERAGQVAAYRMLGTDQVLLGGQNATRRTLATRRTFTCVHVDSDPYVDRLPVVVRGVDLALREGDRVVVVTLLADADRFDANYRYLRRFIQALEL
jgi:hypothetical protein